MPTLSNADLNTNNQNFIKYKELEEGIANTETSLEQWEHGLQSDEDNLYKVQTDGEREQLADTVIPNAQANIDSTAKHLQDLKAQAEEMEENGQTGAPEPTIPPVPDTTPPDDDDTPADDPPPC
jgi:hypothetical protein